MQHRTYARDEAMTPDELYRMIPVNLLAAKCYLALMQQQGRLRQFAEECARTWPTNGVPMNPDVVLASWLGAGLVMENEAR